MDNHTPKLYGDKTRFAIEFAMLPDPDNYRYAGVDEVGTHGYFNLFIAGRSPFRCRYYDMVDDDRLKSGYRILDTYKVFDRGRTDYLAPIFLWLHHAFNVVSTPSKTRFTRCLLPHSPFGLMGNIYPMIGIKRSGNEVVVYAVPDRQLSTFARHVEYTVRARCKVPVAEFEAIMREVLNDFCAHPSITWAKQFVNERGYEWEFDELDRRRVRLMRLR